METYENLKVYLYVCFAVDVVVNCDQRARLSNVLPVSSLFYFNFVFCVFVHWLFVWQ